MSEGSLSSPGRTGPQPPRDGEPLLAVNGLTAGYEGTSVVHEVSLRVHPGEVVVILGSNGAGKTTTLQSIVGLLKPFHASITYDGKAWPLGRPWRAASAGMSYIPAEHFTFAKLTVDENLTLGGYAASREALHERLPAARSMFPILARRGTQAAGTMSGGEQRMLSLAVALMSAPKLLLLDEPSLGLAPAIVQQIMTTLRALVAERGMSVLMVEQNVGQALTIADRVYLMRSGRVLLEESAADTRQRDQWWDLF